MIFHSCRKLNLLHLKQRKRRNLQHGNEEEKTKSSCIQKKNKKNKTNIIISWK